MHLENSVKLDFKDVLIRPKRSTLTSRSEVDITREFKFLHSSEPYHGIPIIAANMDTTGTFEMASALGRHKMSTALHKHYTAKEYVDFFQKLENKSDAFYSLGIGEHDWQKFREVMAAAPGAIRYVCIDVANGYTEAFVAFVKKVRETYPDIVLMAGNVVTGDMTEELLLAGADIVKVGIGPEGEAIAVLHGGELAGGVQLLPQKEPGVGWIGWYGLLPTWRGLNRGIGPLGQAVQYYREKGAQHIRLHCQDAETESFFRHYGFEKTPQGDMDLYIGYGEKA